MILRRGPSARRLQRGAMLPAGRAAPRFVTHGRDPAAFATGRGHRGGRASVVMRQTLAGLALAASVLGPLADAAAAPGTTTAPVYLRAGPSPAYPVVTTLPPGAQLEVLGCVEDWAWCDVAWGAARGWVSAGYLAFPYAGPPAPLYRYGPSIGLTIVPFEFGPYWGRYYRDRPWYADRDRWGPPRYAAPRPRPHPSGPPPVWRPPAGHAGPPPGPPPRHTSRPPGHTAHTSPGPRPHSGPPPNAGRPHQGPPPNADRSSRRESPRGPPPNADRPNRGESARTADRPPRGQPSNADRGPRDEPPRTAGRPPQGESPQGQRPSSGRSRD